MSKVEKWKEMLYERRDRGTLIAIDVPVSKDRPYGITCVEKLTGDVRLL